MNRPATVALTVCAFLGGILLGGLMARRDASEASVKPKPKRPAPSAGPGRSLPADPALVSQLQDELFHLRRRVKELERRGKAEPTSEERSRTAGEIYSALSDPQIHKDPKRWLKVMGRLAELEPDLATFYVRRFREGRPKVDSLALELALGSGGPEAVALLKDIFGNPATPKAERAAAAMCLTGMGLIAQMRPEIAPDPELGEMASRWVSSPDPLERRGGIGILGLQPGDASRATLTSVVSNDPDEPTRAAAIVSLARVGDRSTLEFLRTYASRAAPRLSQPDDESEPTPLEYALMHALEELGRKFSEE